MVALVVGAVTISPVRAQDPVKADATHTKVEFENDQVRVLRFHLGPHEKSPMHEHPERVFVFLTNAHTRVTLEDGKTEERGGNAGEVHHRSAERHAVENLNAQDYESIIVELKPPKRQ
jgi:quercetin dioxygenase-like cupin family protein